jgi:phage gp36-like protein
MPTLQAVSIQDVIDGAGVKVNELLQVAADADVSSNPQLLAAVNRVNDFIYSYIRTRYTLPIERPDSALAEAGTNLVLYALASKRPDIFSEAHITLRGDAIKFLENVRDGKVQLSFPPENRNEAAAPAVLVAVGGDVSSTDYPTASNQSWFAKW